MTGEEERSMKPTWTRVAWLLVAATLVLAGCASRPTKAPVEDRSAPVGSAIPPAPGTAPAVEATAKPLPGAENAGKPGYYTGKPGDTLMRIALESGQAWRDVAKWNGIDNPNVIEVGQVLRIVPPVATASTAPPAVASAATTAAASAGAASSNAVTSRPVAQAGRVDSRSLDAKPPAPVVASAASAPASAAAAGEGASTPAAPADDDVSWMWPASGPVLAGFEEGRNKGLTIGGKAGDPVLAAADGRVVYAGSSLRGYGNLVIIKHNNTYLSAYAHNQTLLVKEDQVVRRGQKIAEMGSTDADRVQLHFEIRRQGKPVDPAKLLPPR